MLFPPAESGGCQGTLPASPQGNHQVTIDDSASADNRIGEFVYQEQSEIALFCQKNLRAESVEWFKEGRAFSLWYGSLPAPFHPPPTPPVIKHDRQRTEWLR